MSRAVVRGVTFVEMMLTVAVVSLVLALGVPNLRSLWLSNRMATQANEFLGAIHLARSEAIRRGVKASLCKSAAPEAPSPSCVASGDWGQGYLVFTDPNDNALFDAGETLLRVHGSLAPSTLTGNINVQDYLSFAADGSARLKNGGGFQAGTLTLCPGAPGVAGRALVLNAAGRLRVEVAACP